MGVGEHHFVPQFYLKGFCDPGSVPKNPRVWVANLAARRVERRSPKSIAKRTGYNAVPGLDEATRESAEQLFSQIETAAAPIIRKLLRGETNLTGQEWVDLLFFAAFLAVRTPFGRDTLEKFFAEIARDVLTLAASHPDYYHQTMREAVPGDLTAEEIEASRQLALTPGALKVRAKAALSLLATFQGANGDVYPAFKRMRWAILRPQSGSFLSSDNPVSWADPTPRPAFYSGHGLGMRNVQVTFPIGPQVCLLGTWEGPIGPLEVGPVDVEQINRRRIGFAVSQVFAHQEQLADFALGLRSKPEQPPPRP